MRLWGAIAIVWTVSACFGGDDSAGGPFVPVDQIDDAFRAAECQHLVACHEMPDQATCMATNLTTALYVDPSTVADVLAGKLRYNGSQVATCFAQLAASTCNPGDLANRRPVEQCLLGMFSGSLHAGEACTANLECISGACGACSGDAQCCSGTCVGDTPPPVAPALGLGSSCPPGTGNFDACPVGAYCDLQTAVCLAVKPAGSPCNGTRECGDGLQCDVFGSLACIAAPRANEPCTAAGRCGDEGTYCANDLICHYVSLGGEACGNSRVCASYTTCDATTQLCKPYPAEGEDCSQTGRCGAYGTHCDGLSNRCVQGLANHEVCGSSIDCASQYCDPQTMTCLDLPSCSP